MIKTDYDNYINICIKTNYVPKRNFFSEYNNLYDVEKELLKRKVDLIKINTPGTNKKKKNIFQKFLTSDSSDDNKIVFEESSSPSVNSTFKKKNDNNLNDNLKNNNNNLNNSNDKKKEEKKYSEDSEVVDLDSFLGKHIDLDVV
jgi:hypothetical protein